MADAAARHAPGPDPRPTARLPVMDSSMKRRREMVRWGILFTIHCTCWTVRAPFMNTAARDKRCSDACAISGVGARTRLGTAFLALEVCMTTPRDPLFRAAVQSGVFYHAPTVSG